MQIKELQINNFGKLKNKNIELENGINIISGKNESGKSTLLKFITSMLYGISKNKNGRKISDYDKYTPWDEGEFSGKIKYYLDNNEGYEIYRNFTKKNPQILDIAGNDVSKNYTIDKTYGSKFFQEQTKVDEELFNTSMVIMQQEVKLDEKQQNLLIQKASNIMLTGEDDVSYKKIMAKLNKRQLEEVGTEKSPTKPIYIIKQKIEELTKKKQDLGAILPLQYEIEEKQAEIEQEVSKGTKELEMLQEIHKNQEEIKLEEEKIELNIKAKGEIEIKKEEEEKKLDRVKSEKEDKKSRKKLYIISLLLTFLTIILYITSAKNISYIVGILDILITISITLIQNKENKEYRKKREEKKLEKNSIENKIELLENEIKEKEKIIKEKQEELENKRKLNKEKIKNKFTDIKNIENFLEKDINSSNILEEQNYINDLKLEISKLEMKRQDIVEKLENISKIEEELENQKENFKELVNYNKSINIAKETLDKAYIEMKENITPKFLNNLSTALRKISDEKYKTVKVNDEEGLMIETKNGNYITPEVLSIGTIDQLYLSLRISSIKELTKENMPIILDETFAYFDDERLENVLKFLDEEYKNNQIVILTCTDREYKILEKMGINYNKVSI